MWVGRGKTTTLKSNDRCNNDNNNILKALNLFLSIRYITFSFKGGILTPMLTLDLFEIYQKVESKQ